MPASRAGGPRRGARREYQQGVDPLYIPRVDTPPISEMGQAFVGAGHGPLLPGHALTYTDIDRSYDTIGGSGGLRNGCTRSYARAARSTICSANRGPTTCIATGRPFEAKPQGTVAAGCWVRLNG